uniref:Uncharacterized protein n=1 Tax=Leersia perrieri TaxID=77586 RepID=A0A0D9WZR0_9ORYZ
MGNCNCLERARAKVTAWGGDDDGDDQDEYWGATAEKKDDGAAGSSSPARRVKIRMTKGQLRLLLDGAGRGAAVEDVVAEIMRMGEVHVEPVEAADDGRRPPQSTKLDTILEDLDE